ncbi:hypothetical protein GPECTOR_168g178 [Gonium pectorale]|uniref:Uncharacterized protein n=1 Tax=Gonium pectorale TaxID=33097 RepID=A0A150FYK5_GONPE|nr:hypothetical protein GPECTOR_168g178 [Gonium pectorale]|eukprot:KXZ42285.1 hypothetical protein GPECTOR_168g178 [Gonium pectorale]
MCASAARCPRATATAQARDAHAGAAALVQEHGEEEHAPESGAPGPAGGVGRAAPHRLSSGTGRSSSCCSEGGASSHGASSYDRVSSSGGGGRGGAGAGGGAGEGDGGLPGLTLTLASACSLVRHLRERGQLMAHTAHSHSQGHSQHGHDGPAGTGKDGTEADGCYRCGEVVGSPAADAAQLHLQVVTAAAAAAALGRCSSGPRPRCDGGWGGLMSPGAATVAAPRPATCAPRCGSGSGSGSGPYRSGSAAAVALLPALDRAAAAAAVVSGRPPPPSAGCGPERRDAAAQTEPQPVMEAEIGTGLLPGERAQRCLEGALAGASAEAGALMPVPGPLAEDDPAVLRRQLAAERARADELEAQVQALRAEAERCAADHAERVAALQSLLAHEVLAEAAAAATPSPLHARHGGTTPPRSLSTPTFPAAALAAAATPGGGAVSLGCSPLSGTAAPGSLAMSPWSPWVPTAMATPTAPAPGHPQVGGAVVAVAAATCGTSWPPLVSGYAGAVAGGAGDGPGLGQEGPHCPSLGLWAVERQRERERERRVAEGLEAQWRRRAAAEVAAALATQRSEHEEAMWEAEMRHRRELRSLRSALACSTAEEDALRARVAALRRDVADFDALICLMTPLGSDDDTDTWEGQGEGQEEGAQRELKSRRKAEAASGKERQGAPPVTALALRQ